MLTIKVETWSLNIAIRQFIKGTQKDVALETQRQAKLLCLELASKASPRPKGVKGLAASIPRIWGKRVRGQIGSIVKGVMSLGLFHLARINDPSVFQRSYYPGKVTPQQRTTRKSYRLFNGSIMFRDVQEVSPLYRIMEAAKKDPNRALKNLRQVLKARLSGNAPTIYENAVKGPGNAAYYQSLNKKAKGGKVEKVFVNTSDPRIDRNILATVIESRIGTVKAGWIQAGLAIPVKAGPRVPSWLTNKRTVGQGQVTQSGMTTGVSMLNFVGNAGGMADRTDYVKEALRSRTAKLRTGLEEALKAQARQWYVRNRQPIPSHLLGGKPKQVDTIDA